MIALTADPIDVAAVLLAVADDGHGGTALFLGTTRGEEGERAIRELRYEAYEELALGELRAIADEAARAYDALVAVQHRTGPVPVGEPSVAVAASAPHRAAAFAACRQVIDELKGRAPIWKQAVGEDGAAAWKDGLGVPGRVAEPQEDRADAR